MVIDIDVLPIKTIVIVHSHVKLLAASQLNENLDVSQLKYVFSVASNRYDPAKVTWKPEGWSQSVAAR